MRKQKKLIPVVIGLTLLSWGLLGYILYAVSPNNPSPLPIPFTISPLPLFFLLFFSAVFFSGYILLDNPRRAFLISFGLTILALLRFFHLFYPLYIVLIAAILTTVEIVYLKRK